MAKLSKKQIRLLQSIEAHLNRAEKYLKDNDVVGIAVKSNCPNGASYIIQNKECHNVHAVEVVNKLIGSDLTGLYMGRQLLSELIRGKP